MSGKINLFFMDSWFHCWRCRWFTKRSAESYTVSQKTTLMLHTIT